MTANRDISQESDIREVFKSRGYGVWIPLPEFPHQHEFNRAISNLRHREDLNIQNKIERSKNAEGRAVTKSWYRLLPGSWRELGGKPEQECHSNRRQLAIACFERTFGKPTKSITTTVETEDLPLFEGVRQ